MTFVLRLLLAVIVVYWCQVVDSSGGYDWTKHLGTKTPYYPQQDYKNHTKLDSNQCEVVYINYVGRHGSRYPSVTDISKLDQLKQTLYKYQDLLNQTNYGWLINWTDPYQFQTAGNLDRNGEEEQYEISKRIRDEYNISVPCCDTVYPIQTTKVPRAARSGNAFGFGLFEDMGTIGPSHYKPFYTYSESLSLDLTLRFFDICPTYTHEVLEKQWGERQAKQYESLYLAQTADRISKFMGVYPQWNISTEIVSAMYTACVFEYALSNATQNWCALFTEEDFKHFEYRGDLVNWWNKAYAFPLSYQISCPLISDILLTFADKIESAPDAEIQKAKFRFAHAETIIPFISLLGLYKDDQQLDWNSSPEFIASRNWNSSWISPFAANVMFVLYQCTEDQETVYYVKTLHNEREVVLPGCSLYCEWSTFNKLFASYLNCDFAALCYEDNQPPPPDPLAPYQHVPVAAPVSSPEEPDEPAAPCGHHVPEDYLSITTTAAIAISAFVLGVILATIGAVLIVRRRISNQQQFETLVD